VAVNCGGKDYVIGKEEVSFVDVIEAENLKPKS
jgi:hypothetical protein